MINGTDPSNTLDDNNNHRLLGIRNVGEPNMTTSTRKSL